MSFPKTMRWADARYRWVRPVHWLAVLHGDRPLKLELFGIDSGRESRGHRFFSPGPVAIANVAAYEEALLAGHVVADPAERRRRLQDLLAKAAGSVGGTVVEDDQLLEEVVDLVEWPGVVVGAFDDSFLELPREILVTTLRHHQKSFSVQSQEGLLAHFLAVANTDRDPGGHVRRGNEWVVSGRLEDARFFWREDRRKPLSESFDKLAAIVFHERAGTFADKAKRLGTLAGRLGDLVGAGKKDTEAAVAAARLAKVDLSTALVGEFPELQGIVGGLLLREEGAETAVADGVYEQYRPEGPADPVPATIAGCLVAIADKLDNVAVLIEAGERATGSRDPFGLRRAANGVFRIAIGRQWPLTVDALIDLGGGGDDLREFLQDRLVGHLRDRGYSSNEIQAVLRPQVEGTKVDALALPDVISRLDAIRGVRGRDDFRNLVKLTERANNIVMKNDSLVRGLESGAGNRSDYNESENAAVSLRTMMDRHTPTMESQSANKDYERVVELLSEFIDPVEKFFEDVLVIDESHPEATCHRYALVAELRDLLTRYFDIRELAGQADRRT